MRTAMPAAGDNRSSFYVIEYTVLYLTYNYKHLDIYIYQQVVEGKFCEGHTARTWLFRTASIKRVTLSDIGQGCRIADL